MEEKRNFEKLMARWADHPDMHVYHFAPYEPGAVKRLMGDVMAPETNRSIRCSEATSSSTCTGS